MTSGSWSCTHLLTIYLFFLLLMVKPTSRHLVGQNKSQHSRTSQTNPVVEVYWERDPRWARLLNPNEILLKKSWLKQGSDDTNSWQRELFSDRSRDQGSLDALDRTVGTDSSTRYDWEICAGICWIQPMVRWGPGIRANYAYQDDEVLEELELFRHK